MKKTIFITILFVFIHCGVVSKLTEKQICGIVDNAVIALYEESNLTIARSAIESDIKLLEGLTKTYENNKRLGALLSQAYCAYSLGFVEDYQKEEGIAIYRRGRKEAEKILGIHLDEITSEELKNKLNSFKTSRIDGVFWAAFNWSLELFLSLDNPSAIMNLNKIKILMDWVTEKNSHYYFGAPYIFWGAYYAILPPIAGGSLEKSKEFFNLAFETSENKFLLAHYYFLSQYCLTLLDEELFESTYNKIINFDLEQFPQQRLANQIAKEKARLLYGKKNEFF